MKSKVQTTLGMKLSHLKITEVIETNFYQKYFTSKFQEDFLTRMNYLDV